MDKPPSTDTITLAGGCFWCLEAVYEQVRGVVSVESGYSNGQVANPSYEAVCRGDTGHAEVVRVEFDRRRRAARAARGVLQHPRPDHPRSAGNDVGPQYRSGIYTRSDAQAAAREVIAEVNAATGGRVVTELEPVANYWRAEPYHQHYFAQHPGQGYCAFVVAPKVEKFRHSFARLMKA
jgi:peptide-methionine (S)-S-oxide reductase